MNYKEAEQQAENYVFARSAIQTAVDSVRLRQQEERQKFMYKTGVDSTATAALHECGPVPVVRCIYYGVPMMVYQPELWLKAIKDSFNLFRQRFGDKAYKVIQHRFIYHWTPKHVTAVDGVSLQTYSLRRRDFLAGLLILAAQNGAIKLDSSLPKEK